MRTRKPTVVLQFRPRSVTIRGPLQHRCFALLRALCKSGPKPKKMGSKLGNLRFPACRLAGRGAVFTIETIGCPRGSLLQRISPRRNQPGVGIISSSGPPQILRSELGSTMFSEEPTCTPWKAIVTVPGSLAERRRFSRVSFHGCCRLVDKYRLDLGVVDRGGALEA